MNASQWFLTLGSADRVVLLVPALDCIVPLLWLRPSSYG